MDLWARFVAATACPRPRSRRKATAATLAQMGAAGAVGGPGVPVGVVRARSRPTRSCGRATTCRRAGRRKRRWRGPRRWGLRELRARSEYVVGAAMRAGRRRAGAAALHDRAAASGRDGAGGRQPEAPRPRRPEGHPRRVLSSTPRGSDGRWGAGERTATSMLNAQCTMQNAQCRTLLAPHTVGILHGASNSIRVEPVAT